jgi:D-alanyl-D-alanine dipeptidase
MTAGRAQRTREPISALNRVPLRERGEPLVDIRRECPGLRVSRRCMPFLRVTVAEMLNRAQASLPVGHSLWVRTALRTIEMQRDGYERRYGELQKQHPDWPHATLRRQTNRHFAPVDQRAPPGHCTGGAVDVWLLTASGRPAALASPFSMWEGAATWQQGLTPAAQANRAILYQAMIGAGFSNCEEEFWHYSYGDAAWAVRAGADHCIYGLALPPEKWRERRPDVQHKLRK